MSKTIQCVICQEECDYVTVFHGAYWCSDCVLDYLAGKPIYPVKSAERRGRDFHFVFIDDDGNEVHEVIPCSLVWSTLRSIEVVGPIESAEEIITDGVLRQRNYHYY